MIGGQDVVFENVDGRRAAALCLDVLQQIWPDAICEDALSDASGLPISQFRSNTTREILVYANQDVFARANKEGIDEVVANESLYILYSPTQLTVVVNDTESWPFNEIVAALDSNLSPTSHLIVETTDSKWC